jgi:hypothetical protein
VRLISLSRLNNLEAWDSQSPTEIATFISNEINVPLHVYVTMLELEILRNQ